MQGIVGLETNLGTLHIQVSALCPYYRKIICSYYLTGVCCVCVWGGAFVGLVN